MRIGELGNSNKDACFAYVVKPGEFYHTVLNTVHQKSRAACCIS
jgi:hypothetical protein